jgi:hypothetical protein
MNSLRLAIIGAGSVRCTPAVLASLATYFGERPLEVRMFDADVERLDLFDRLARVMFIMTHTTHSLLSTTDATEALVDAERIVLQVGENCARKYLKERHRMGIANLEASAMIEQAVEEILGTAPAEAEILSLQRADILIPRDHFYRVDWLEEPTARERQALPHQALRWIRGEDYTHEILRDFERSPLKAWLDDVNSAERVSTAGLVGE